MDLLVIFLFPLLVAVGAEVVVGRGRPQFFQRRFWLIYVSLLAVWAIVFLVFPPVGAWIFSQMTQQ